MVIDRVVINFIVVVFGGVEVAFAIQAAGNGRAEGHMGKCDLWTCLRCLKNWQLSTGLTVSIHPKYMVWDDYVNLELKIQ